MNKPELPIPICFSTLHGNIYTTDQLEQYAKDYHKAMLGEPYAYAVYFPDQPCEEIVHDLDELLDDLTNRDHEVTPLYAPKEES